MILNTPTSKAQVVGLAETSVYVVENAALERLLFDRNVIGADFQRACLAATKEFLRHLADELSAGDTAELVILSKGLAYQVANASLSALDLSLPLNFIATRRAAVSDGDVKIEVEYARTDTSASTVVIGDTVASGETIVAALTALLDAQPVRRLVLMSFAGAGVGAGRIAGFCADNGIELICLFGLAAFGLGSNGFDLSFVDSRTVCNERYRERAALQFDGRPVSAVGWDFGSQWFAPEKYRHLCWLEAEKWDLHGHPSLALELEPESMTHLSAELAALST